MTRDMDDAIRRAEHSDDDAVEFSQPHVPHSPAQVYSVRIPVDRIEQLRRVAARQGTAPSSLIRTWVLEHLDAEAAEPVAFLIELDSVDKLLKEIEHRMRCGRLRI